MDRRTHAIMLVLLTAAIGCGRSGQVPPDALPGPSNGGGGTIGPDDLLAITVLDAPELSRTTRVAGDGAITMPLIGSVHASGRTPHELEDAIAAQLRGRYMVDPQVSVEVTERRSRVVYVLGEVNQPGGYPVPGSDNLTVLRALALGEGLKPNAAKGQARIIRGGGGQRMEIPVDVGDLLAGRAPDVPMQPDDVLFVPGSTAKSVLGGFWNAFLRVVTLRGVF